MLLVGQEYIENRMKELKKMIIKFNKNLKLDEEFDDGEMLDQAISIISIVDDMIFNGELGEMETIKYD